MLFHQFRSARGGVDFAINTVTKKGLTTALVFFRPKLQTVEEVRWKHCCCEASCLRLTPNPEYVIRLPPPSAMYLPFEAMSFLTSLLPPPPKVETSSSDATVTIASLGDDVLLQIFSYLTASDLDFGVSLACKSLHRIASSPILWRDLCRITGKSKADIPLCTDEPSIDSDFYFCLYHRVPCVPMDFATIRQALDIAPPGSSITLLPGVYEERLVIKSSVRIRAADPKLGAAVVWHHRCRNHTKGGSGDCDCGGRENESVVEVEESSTYVSLQHLTLLHYTEGTDLWRGNCAVYCRGRLTHTHFDGCSIQSDSGRGIVISNGAEVILARSSVHDCAATGVYLGDDGSSLDIGNSNILRNGFGRRPLQVGVSDQTTSTQGIQPGHSGLYVEAADADIRNTLVAGNCLTGLSVVRDGNVHLSHNAFVGNGADPVVIFQDEGDVDDDDRSEGGVYEHSNIFEYAAPSPEEMEANMIRCPQIHHRPLSKEMLFEIYNP